jgi:hypothetical protein
VRPTFAYYKEIQTAAQDEELARLELPDGMIGLLNQALYRIAEAKSNQKVEEIQEAQLFKVDFD